MPSVNESWNSVRCLESTQEGIFLTIFPFIEKSPEKILSALEKEFKARGLKDVNWKEVERAFCNRPHKIKIAPPQSISTEGVVLVEISSDEMEAYAYAFPPLNNGAPLTLNTILEAIKSVGVTSGLDEDAIMELLTLKFPENRIIIAKGQAPSEGHDAEIKYYFPVTDKKRKPLELEDGRVDFYNLNIIHNVQNGQILARKIPAVAGKSGLTVTGKPIKPRPTKDLPLLPGTNTEIAEDGLTLLATSAGYVTLEGRRVHVKPLYVVTGDVDFSTGNIDFIGSVIVHGSIKSGFIVHSGRDVEVNQVVEGGTIRAEGNVYIKNGIRGLGTGKVIASGSIYAKFIENATVEAGQDVVVKDSIIHSNISSGGKVILKERLGHLLGGFCCACKGIEAKVIGSSLAVTTELEVGVNPMITTALKSLLKQDAEVKHNLDKIEKALQLLLHPQKLGKELSKKEKRLLKKLVQTRQKLQDRMQVIQLEKDKLITSLNTMSQEKVKVKVKDCIYPGVRIKFGSLSYCVKDKMQHVVLFRDGDDINVFPC